RAARDGLLALVRTRLPAGVAALHQRVAELESEVVELRQINNALMSSEGGDKVEEEIVRRIASDLLGNLGREPRQRIARDIYERWCSPEPAAPQGRWRCEGCGEYVEPDPSTPQGRGHPVPNADGSPGFCGPISREPAAPDAGVEALLDALLPIADGVPTRDEARGIITAHTAALRRERDEAKKALAETESDLEALAAPCGTIQQRITVEREKYRLACDERDAARTDLAAAVRLLERAKGWLSNAEVLNDIDAFIASRKEAPK
ncbi:MAG TPA: hypothetical protein VFX78_11375, partial [Candidatus Eisenbacteria bacterium]|nr:hypothetical protein [Candidatus Eisenbacteria bacterium]